MPNKCVARDSRTGELCDKPATVHLDLGYGPQQKPPIIPFTALCAKHARAKEFEDYKAVPYQHVTRA